MDRLDNMVKELTRNFRKNQTQAEAKLWRYIRNRKIGGYKFLRQYPIKFELDGKKKFFIADFYCPKAKLAIEVDGKIHLQQEEYDKIRDSIIKKMGIKMLRITNEEIETDINRILKYIIKNSQAGPIFLKEYLRTSGFAVGYPLSF